jgi:hypothetical protein
MTDKKTTAKKGTSETTATKVISGFPSSEYAFKYFTYLLPCGQQPYSVDLVDKLTEKYGIKNLDEIKTKVRNGFNTSRKIVLAADTAYDDGKNELDESVLSSGQRYLHPRMFDDFGFHKLLVDPTIRQRIREDEDFKHALTALIEDTLKYPDKVRNTFNFN